MQNWLRKEILTAGGLVIVAAGQIGAIAGFLPSWADVVGWVAVAAGSIMYLTGR